MGVKVTKFPIQRVGAARQYSEDSIIRRYRMEDDLKCPGFEPTYHYDGKVYPCCSPTVFTTNLSLGETNKLLVDQAVSNIERNILFGAIRNKGFKWLFERCVQEGVLDNSYLDKWYVDACEMCQIIFSNPNVSSVAASIIVADFAEAGD